MADFGLTEGGKLPGVNPWKSFVEDTLDDRLISRFLRRLITVCFTNVFQILNPVIPFNFDKNIFLQLTYCKSL